MGYVYLKKELVKCDIFFAFLSGKQSHDIVLVWCIVYLPKKAAKI
jgi:hypothetical protein